MPPDSSARVTLPGREKFGSVRITLSHAMLDNRLKLVFYLSTVFLLLTDNYDYLN